MDGENGMGESWFLDKAVLSCFSLGVFGIDPGRFGVCIWRSGYKRGSWDAYIPFVSRPSVLDNPDSLIGVFVFCLVNRRVLRIRAKKSRKIVRPEVPRLQLVSLRCALRY